MQWDELKRDREKFIDAINQYGARGLARKLNLDHATILYWTRKYGLEYDQEQALYIEAEEERAPDIEDCGDRYIIRSGKRELEITKDLLREVKKLYCGPDPLTINQICRELEIPRRDFFLVKNAFGITHDDVPYIDEDIRERNIEELVDETLEHKKKQYYIKLQQKEYEQLQQEIYRALSELKKYRKQDYFIKRLLEETRPALQAITSKPPKININFCDSAEPKTLILNISDWHIGKRIEGDKLIGRPEGYNHEIFLSRLQKTIDETAAVLQLYPNIHKVVVIDYGDKVDDPEAQVYEGQAMKQDLTGHEQYLEALKALEELLINIYHLLPEVEYHGITGNHAAGLATNWDYTIAEWLKDRMQKYESIKVHSYQEQDAAISIMGSEIIATHGREIRKGRYTEQVDLLNMLRMRKNNNNKTYICMGHWHHRETRAWRQNILFILAANTMSRVIKQGRIRAKTADEAAMKLREKYGNGHLSLKDPVTHPGHIEFTIELEGEEVSEQIEGVGKNQPIVENERGGKQSDTPYGFHLMDPTAMFRLAEVLQHGAQKYERDNWRRIDCEDHLNHALQHIFAHMAGDTQDDHLGHAFCRLMMAVATEED